MSGQLAAHTDTLVRSPLVNKEKTVCEERKGCQKPENLQGDPQKCSPEQIRKCHGDDREHPCVDSDDEE